MNEPDAPRDPDPADEATASVLDDMAMVVHVPTVTDAPDVDGPDLEASTGHAVVDDVVRSLGALDESPVAEHVAVFERAHDSLRRTLSDAGEPGTGQPERG